MLISELQAQICVLASAWTSSYGQILRRDIAVEFDELQLANP
jgi:hypothetical protein